MELGTTGPPDEQVCFMGSWQSTGKAAVGGEEGREGDTFLPCAGKESLEWFAQHSLGLD